MTAARATTPAEEEPHLLTAAEYLELGEPRSGYAELTEGRLTMVPSPGRDHNYAGFRLGMQLAPQLPEHLEVVPDIDVDLQLAQEGQPGFCRRPDLIVVERSAGVRQRAEGGLLRASDVVVAIEVISPGSRRTDTVVKRAEYADAGIPHYWILDLAEPVSLRTLHHAGEIGYAVTGEHTGRVGIAEPFPVALDLAALL